MEQKGIYKGIYKKLLSFQKEVGAVIKDSDNPFFHSKYVDINGILALVKPVLSTHGLVLIQAINIIEGRNGLYTAIVDPDTDEKVESQVFLPELADVQKLGGAITYFRRYTLQSLLALQAEDDDGNMASGNASGKSDTSKDKKTTKNEEKFFEDMQPTEEEIILQKDRLEACNTVTELKSVWKTIPPMVQDKLQKVKDDLKFKLV